MPAWKRSVGLRVGEAMLIVLAAAAVRLLIVPSWGEGTEFPLLGLAVVEHLIRSGPVPAI
jgi:hypothetical protein